MVREQIMAALFAKLTQSGYFKTTGRRLPAWSTLTELPALFLIRGDEHYPAGPDHPANKPRMVPFEVHLWLYTKTTDPDAVPETALNGMLDEIDQAIAPDQSFRFPQTLGLHAVLSCRIEGAVLTEIGHTTGQVFAKVPLIVTIAEGQ